MPTEDHPSPQIGTEEVLGTARFEVLVAQLRGERFQGLGRVQPRASLAQRLLVDVRGVDLDAIQAFVETECLREHDRKRVRLLTAGTTGTPHPDLVLGGNVGDHLRHDLALEQGPCLRVPEDRSDVDQNGVEQGAELVGVRLQEVLVVRVVVDTGIPIRLRIRRPSVERL